MPVCFVASLQTEKGYHLPNCEGISKARTAFLNVVCFYGVCVFTITCCCVHSSNSMICCEHASYLPCRYSSFPFNLLELPCSVATIFSYDRLCTVHYGWKSINSSHREAGELYLETLFKLRGFAGSAGDNH